jgi:hypothetical protein
VALPEAAPADLEGKLQRAELLGHHAGHLGLPAPAAPPPHVPGPNLAITPGAGAVQRLQHGAIGTMIHHAPPAAADPVIDGVNKGFYPARAVLDSRRGGLLEKGGETYDWDFPALAQRIADMRERTGVPPESFPIVINANRMVSPGLEAVPKE